MLVNFVPSAHGALNYGPVQLETVHAGYAGSEALGTTFLLFEFKNDNDSDTVGVQVICSDSQVEADPVVFWWERGERGIKCVEFSDFAPPQSQGVAYNCKYKVQYLDLQTGTNPGALEMNVYSG